MLRTLARTTSSMLLRNRAFQAPRPSRSLVSPRAYKDEPRREELARKTNTDAITSDVWNRPGSLLPFSRLATNLDAMQRDLDSMLSTFMPSLVDDGWLARPRGTTFSGFDSMLTMPRMDLTEAEKAYELKLEVPGFPKDALDVHLEPETRLLSIKGSIKAEAGKEGGKEAKDKTGKSARSFATQLRLPEDVDAHAQPSASLEHGILTITLPRVSPSVQAPPKGKKIEIK